MEVIGTIIGIIAIVGFFGGLIYAFLFHADSSNFPLAVRGVGVMLLSGAIKVIFIVISDNVSRVFDSEWFDYGLSAMAAVGFFYDGCWIWWRPYSVS
jgi:Co/Zn/Cd efflux system component